MMNKVKLFLIGLLALVTVTSTAQLTIDQEITPENAVQQLVGTGVAIENVVVNAADSSWAYYYNSNTELSSTEGLLLTTGKARNAIVTNGENGTGVPILENQTDCINCDEFDNGFPGSALLNTVNDRTTFDATSFVFDVKVQGDSLSFDFTFASEEYEEWVGSAFNDVFGFFISGPGGFNDVNIALIPGSNESVAINSVNNIFNTEYYYDNRNPLGQNIQYDGFTLGLKASVGGLIPCETYTLKLIIADGTDRLYDSAVFIEKLNSNFSDIETATDGGTPYMIEGCNDGTITFIAEEVLPVDQDILYSFGGTADILTDYMTSPSLGTNIPLEQQSITIPANETSVSIDVSPIQDNVTEGDEFITLYVINTVCDVDIQDSIQFVIKDSLELSVIPEVLEVCAGDQITLEGISDTNGAFGFSWEPAALVDNPDELITTATINSDTEFTLTSTLSDCVAQDNAFITAKLITFSFDVTPVNCSGAAIGAIDATINGALAPLTITWTDSDGNFISNDEDISGLPTGQYIITVLDDLGCEETASVLIFEENTLESNLVLSDYNGSLISCNGSCDGSATVTPSGGVGPYTITWSENVPENTTTLNDLCPGNYTVTIEDSDGCILNENFTITEPDELEGAVLSVSEILCNGTSTGEASVTATGGTAPYFYSWSNDPSGSPILGQGPMLVGLGDGTYFVTVTDANDCQAENSVLVTVLPPPPPISISLTALQYGNGFNTTCFDSNDGQLTAIITGGSPGYTIEWTDPNGNDAGSGIILTGAQCGTYTVTVTDDNECVETETIEVICPTQVTATFVVTPNPCNDPLATSGAIDLTPSGGSGMGYTFSWQNQNGDDFGMTEDLSNLASGDYTVTITDSDGCSRDITISINEEANFTITPIQVSNNTCFESCDGIIDVDITGVPGDYTVEWSTLDGVFSSDEDLTDLCADTYFLEVTADDGCQSTSQFDITQPSEITIELVEAIDPNCAGQNSGSIDISVGGGDGALTTNWEPLGIFPGSTDEDIQLLLAGTYTVNVTDQSNMCVESLEVTLIAPPSINVDIQLSNYDGGFFSSCADESDGQLTAAAFGGNPDFTNLEFGYIYDWSNLPLSNDPSIPNQENLPGGVTYGLVVTDTAGCQVEIIIPTVEPDTLEAIEILSNISCNGLTDGEIISNVTGGSGNYVSYEWTGNLGDNPNDGTELTDLSAGIYTLEVFDSNGCTFLEEYEIIEPEILELEVDDITQEDCFQVSTASVTLTASGGTPNYNFNWEDQDGVMYTGAVQNDLPGGTYEITLTDQNNCSVIDTLEINSDDIFSLNVTLTAPGTGAYTLACLGDQNGSATALAEGGIPDYTYVWTDNSSTNIGNEPTISDLGSGTYYIDVTDLAGCALRDSILITEPLTEFTAEASITNEINCYGICEGEIAITSSGGDPDYVYVWELNNDMLDFGDTAADLCAGDYEILAIDANGCDTLISITLEEPEEIIVSPDFSSYIGGFGVSCFGSTDGQISVDIIGGNPDYTLEWVGDLGANAMDNDTLFNIGSGSYELTVTDFSDCVVTNEYILTQPDTLTIEEIITDITCFNLNNGIIDANPQGGSGVYEFQWDHTPDNVQVVEDLSNTFYTVNVTDENGCEASEEFEVNEPPLLSVSASASATSCGLLNGSIDSTPEGGIEPYTFEWDNGANNVEDPSNLDSGIYTLTLTDSNDCVITLPVEIESSIGISIDSETVTDVLCFGESTGCIEVIVDQANGNTDFTFLDNEGNISAGCDISTGEYALTIEDEEGCIFENQYNITQPDSLEILLTSELYPNEYNISTFEGNDGSIISEVEGGVPDYTYDWTGPGISAAESEDQQNLIEGLYFLTITDANNCVLTDSILLLGPQDLALPTGLTPNGDGFNDFYTILGLDQYDELELTVFNRWGNKVYTNANYANNWDGLNDNGDQLADGTYYVIAIARRGSENRELNSYVDLRR